MPGVEEVKLHVAASIDEVDQAVIGIRAVTDRIEEALHRLQIIMVGSTHPRAAEAILRFEAAKEKLVEAQSFAMAGIEAAQAYHSMI